MAPNMRASSFCHFFVFFSLYLSHASFANTKVPTPDLKQDVANILKNKSLRGADVGVLIKSLKTNQIIYEKNGSHLLNPASNVKLVTTLAALHLLKPEFKFKTDYLSDGSNLYIKGYGDPSVTTERLRTVAHQLKLRGLSVVSGDLVLDESFFDSQNYAKGHDKEKNNSKAWAAPTSALSLNRNVFEVFMRSKDAGQPSYCSIEPQSPYFQTLGTVKSVKKGFSPRISLSSNHDKMTVQLSGSMGEKIAPQSFFRRVANPSEYFGQTFRVLLEAEGIKIMGSIRDGITPVSAKSLFVDRSPRLADVVNETNKFSSNFMAEMLVKAIAGSQKSPATFEDGLSVIRTFLENKVGLKPGSYVLGNGSGLNHVNEFSARQLVQVLEFGTKDFEIASEFISSLSVAGTQGTLSRRLKEPSMLRQLRAKTGTLSGVSALTGYMPGEKDDLLLFAIMFDGHKSSSYRMTQIQDEISRKLAKKIKFIDDTNLDGPANFDYEGEENANDEFDEMAGGG